MTRELFGNDPYPYGVKANRKMLETLIDFSHEQGLTSKKMKVEELFAASTLDL
jgi:4,5-dihydroxyphthalate decarboxylase